MRDPHVETMCEDLEKKKVAERLMQRNLHPPAKKGNGFPSANHRTPHPPLPRYNGNN